MRAVVTGRGEFPLDMLRRDCAYPASEMDAYEMMRTFDGDRRSWVITIDTANRRGYTIDRWESFGCTVENIIR